MSSASDPVDGAVPVAAELQRRGGHCVYTHCTETRIDWHHRDPKTKLFNVGGSAIRTVGQLRAELAKCDPLCRRHHKRVQPVANVGILVVF